MCWFIILGQLTASVDEKRLLASHRVRANNRMHGFDRLAPHMASTIAAELCLLDTGVLGLQPVKSLLEYGRQTSVGLDLVGEQGIPSYFGPVEKV